MEVYVSKHFQYWQFINSTYVTSQGLEKDTKNWWSHIFNIGLENIVNINTHNTDVTVSSTKILKKNNKIKIKEKERKGKRQKRN